MKTLNHLVCLSLFGTIVSESLNSKFDISLGGAKLEVGGSLDLGAGKSEKKSNIDISLGGGQRSNSDGNFDINGASSLKVEGINPAHHIQEGIHSVLDIGHKGATHLNSELEGAHKTLSDLSLDIAGKASAYEGRAGLDLGGAGDLNIGLSGTENLNVDIGAASKSGLDVVTGLVDKTESELKSLDVGNLGPSATGSAAIGGRGNLNLGLIGETKSFSNLDVDTSGVGKIESDLSGKINGLKVGLEETASLGIGAAEDVHKSIKTRLDGGISSVKSEIDGEIDGLKQSSLDLQGSTNLNLNLGGNAESGTDLKLESKSTHEIQPSLQGSQFGGEGGLSFGLGAGGKFGFGLGGGSKSTLDTESSSSGIADVDLDAGRKAVSNPNSDVELINQKVVDPQTKSSNNGVKLKGGVAGLEFDGKHNLTIDGKIKSELDLNSNGAIGTIQGMSDGNTEIPSISSQAQDIKNPGMYPDSGDSNMRKGITKIELGGTTGFHFGLGNQVGMAPNIGKLNVEGAVKPNIDLNGKLFLNESQSLISDVGGMLNTQLNGINSKIREHVSNMNLGLKNDAVVAPNLKENLELNLDLKTTRHKMGTGLLNAELEGSIKPELNPNTEGITKSISELGTGNHWNGSLGGTSSETPSTGWNIGFGIEGKSSTQAETDNNFKSNATEEVNSSGKSAFRFAGPVGWNLGLGATAKSSIQTGENIGSKAKLIGDVNSTGKADFGFGGGSGWNGWGGSGGWNLGFGGKGKSALCENIESKAKSIDEVNSTEKTILGFDGKSSWNGWGGTGGWNLGLGSTEKTTLQTGVDDSKAKLIGEVKSTEKSALGFGGTTGWNGWGGTAGWNLGFGGAGKSALQTGENIDLESKPLAVVHSTEKTALWSGGSSGWNGWGGTGGWNLGLGSTAKSPIHAEVDDSKAKLIGEVNSTEKSGIGFGGANRWNGWGTTGGWNLGLGSAGNSGLPTNAGLSIASTGGWNSGLGGTVKSSIQGKGIASSKIDDLNTGLGSKWILGLGNKEKAVDRSFESLSIIDSESELQGIGGIKNNVNAGVGSTGLNIASGNTDSKGIDFGLDGTQSWKLGVSKPDLKMGTSNLDEANSNLKGATNAAMSEIDGSLKGATKSALDIHLGGEASLNLAAGAGVPNLKIGESRNNLMGTILGSNSDGIGNLNISTKDAPNKNLNPDFTQVGELGGGHADVNLESSNLTTAGNLSDNKKSKGINVGAGGIDAVKLGNSAAPNLISGSKTNLGANIEEGSELDDLLGKTKKVNKEILKTSSQSEIGNSQSGIDLNFGGKTTFNLNGARGVPEESNFSILNGGISLTHNLNSDLTNKLKATGGSLSDRTNGEIAYPNIGLDGNTGLKFKNGFNLGSTSKLGGEIRGGSDGPGLHLTGGAALSIDTEGQEKIASATKQKISGALHGVAQGVENIGNAAVAGLDNLRSDLEGGASLAIEGKTDIGGDIKTDGKNSKLGLHLSVGDNKHGFEAGIGGKNGEVKLRFGSHRR